MVNVFITMLYGFFSLFASYALLMGLKLIYPYANMFGIESIQMNITNILLGAIFFALIFKGIKGDI